MALDLQPEMPGGVATELTTRATDTSNRALDWMYKKSAYINIRTTGKTQTAICPDKWSIGDSSAPDGGHLSMYGTESGIRKMLPTITSVKMVNEGGQDYTDSYLWEIEFSFKLFSMSDLNLAEASFFRVGGEVEFDFGWRNNANAGINQGTMLANVYNFSFSMESDGGFNCSVKCMSPNGLWKKPKMGGVSNADENAAPESAKSAPSAWLGHLLQGRNTAFGLSGNQEAIDAGINDASDNNTLVSKAGTITTSGVILANRPFWVAELLSAQGFWNDTEVFCSYTNLETLIQYTNAKLKGNSIVTYEFGEGGDSSIHSLYTVGSADPSQIVIPGSHAKYQESGNFDWSQASLENNNPPNSIKGIMLEIGYLNRLYMELAKDAGREVTDGSEPNVSIQTFLKTIFNDIERLTGGLVKIQLIPETKKQGDASASNTKDSPSTILIVNRRKVESPQKVSPYEFKLMSENSIVRSVTLDTDFDADTIMMASYESISGGKTASGKALAAQYPECSELSSAVADSTTSADGDSITDTEAKLKKRKYGIGDDGYTDSTINTLSDANKSYLMQLAATGHSQMTSFRESLWMLKLSVVIDGIHGIPFMAPITVDRLPSKYRNKNAGYFSITSIEHSFDGQGGWETSLDTIMRIQG